jgi:hypothetical protein
VCSCLPERDGAVLSADWGLIRRLLAFPGGVVDSSPTPSLSKVLPPKSGPQPLAVARVDAPRTVEERTTPGLWRNSTQGEAGHGTTPTTARPGSDCACEPLGQPQLQVSISGQGAEPYPGAVCILAGT